LRAETLETEADRQTAIAQLQELTAEFPRYYLARLSLAGLLFKAQRYREAAAEFAELHRARPDEAYVLTRLAEANARLGEVDAAAPLMAELEERFPDNSEALLTCARFALAQGDAAHARPLLTRAVERNPNDHEIHRELGVCLDRLGDKDGAREHLERSRQ